MRDSADFWAAPDGSPVGTSGWYLASDGVWYQSPLPPAVGYRLGDDGRWHPPDALRAPWYGSRWGLGDVWWGVLAYVLAGIVAVASLGLVNVFRQGDDALDDTSPVALGIFVAGNAIAIGGVVSFASRRKGLKSLRKDFGLDGRWLDPLLGLGLGVAGMIAAGLASWGIDSALGADEQTSNLPVDELTSFGDFAVFFVAVALVTPVVEELFFRGLVYRSLLKRGRSTFRAIAITTAIFVIPHLPAAETWVELVSLSASIAILGLAFNLACRWSQNRLAAPITAHMMVNGLAAIALYVT